MSRLAQMLRNDERGAAAVEFALAIPVLVSMIWGIFQVGTFFEANAGMQQALGEGARYATLYVADTSDHRPTDADIKARMETSAFKPTAGQFTASDPVDGAGFKTLTVSYQMPLDFLFFDGPTVTLTKSKKVYVTT